MISYNKWIIKRGAASEKPLHRVKTKAQPKRDRKHKREDLFLLCDEGRIELPSGKLTRFKQQKEFPDLAAVFQINKKLFVCGGFAFINLKSTFLSGFFSLNSSGTRTDLPPL